MPTGHRQKNSYHLEHHPHSVSIAMTTAVNFGHRNSGTPNVVHVTNNIAIAPDGPSSLATHSTVTRDSVSTIDLVDHHRRLDNRNDGPLFPRARERWATSAEFLFTCIASSVGLGNVWKFPFIAYKNGGAAFLIPYLVVLTFIGRPIYFLEMVLGQFSSYGQVKVWNMVPFFKGLGYGSMMGMICLVSYYACLMGLTVFYCFSSFQNDLPWATCNEAWVSLGCEKEPNLQCNASDLRNAYGVDYPNDKSNCTIAQLYFENAVLQQKRSIEDGIGAPEWRLSLCLLFTWILIWACLIKGITSSGKVAYFTALFPYVVLIIMLIRGVTLPGASVGIWYFLEPDWDKMADPNVWHQAVAQCFFSLSIGFGSIIMLSSYNPFHYNVFRDAWIITILDTFTSLLAGITIFAVLGNLAHELNISMDKVAEMDGLGLAFVSYPAAIARFDWVTQLFAVLFYLMLFTLGVGSATSLVGAIVTVVCDNFPKLPAYHVTTIASICLFFIGLVYVTPGGQFILTLVDYFGANFVIYIITTLEVVAVAWVYGLKNFLVDIQFMLGVKIGWYWKVCWGFFVPFGLTAILIYSLSFLEMVTFNGRQFPDAAIASGWVIASIALSAFPICALHTVKTRKSRGWFKKLKESLKPSVHWGPMKITDRVNWIQFKSKIQ